MVYDFIPATINAKIQPGVCGWPPCDFGDARREAAPEKAVLKRSFQFAHLPAPVAIPSCKEHRRVEANPAEGACSTFSTSTRRPDCGRRNGIPAVAGQNPLPPSRWKRAPGRTRCGIVIWKSLARFFGPASLLTAIGRGFFTAAIDELKEMPFDWVYPKAGPSSETFLALMRELRAALPKAIMLTAAVAALGRNADGIPTETFALIDFANLMVYDGNPADHLCDGWKRGCEWTGSPY